MRNWILFTFFFLTKCLVSGQDFPYEIKIDSISIPELGGLQSYAFGQANGKWLIIGGRLDGLHRRQPWATFDKAGHNTQLLVVDPIEKKKWTAPLSAFPQDLQEQLSSTNIQFIQRGELLYLIGGYGFSATDDDHKTFPFLTIVQVDKVIDAITEQRDPTPFFFQTKDEYFAVTGGQLQSVEDAFYLVGGHRFDGRYNPMDNPTFIQTYTNSIRKFTVDFDGKSIQIDKMDEIISEEHLHRRDFNVLPQILPNGQQGLIAFSGVFQQDVNLPYLNSVTIDASGFQVNKGFAQYYNHYHCATISMFENSENKMYNLFFGGIAQYYDSSGILVQDNDVPFVRTVACVTRDQNGWMQEFKLPVEMPAYLGAASEFIINPELTLFSNEVVDLSTLENDTTLLGYIYGGIQSSAANIFWINTGVESSASQMIYPIYLIKDPMAGKFLNEQSINAIQLQIYPNPTDGELSLSFNMLKEGNVDIVIKNLMGEIAYERVLKKVPVGEFARSIKFKDLERGDVYYLHLTINGKTITQKMIVN